VFEAVAALAERQSEDGREIPSDRQVTDLILVDMDAGGDLGGEVAFGAAAVGFEGATGDLAAATAGGNGLTSSALDVTTLPQLAAGRRIKLGDGDNAGKSFATAACYVGGATMYNQILNSTLIPRSTCGSAAPTATARGCCSTSRRSSCRGARRRCQQEPGRDDPGRLPGLHARHLGYTMSVSRFRYVPTSSGCRTFLALAAETQRCLLIDPVAVRLALPRAATL
jgi:hypothetical protein